MVRTFLKVYMEIGSYFVSARTNKRYDHHRQSMILKVNGNGAAAPGAYVAPGAAAP
jgi:hypothetical protein